MQWHNRSRKVRLGGVTAGSWTSTTATLAPFASCLECTRRTTEKSKMAPTRHCINPTREEKPAAPQCWVPSAISLSAHLPTFAMHRHFDGG